MMINEIFKEDEIKNIKDRIENMPVEGCIEKYTKYASTKYSELDGIEKKYIKKLHEDIRDAYAEYYHATYIATLSKEAILEKTLSMIKDGNTGTDNNDYDYILEDWGCFNDADCHEFIKNRMLTILDKVIEEANKTEKQKKIDELKNNIKYYTRRIKQDKDNILHCEAKLMNANAQLENLGEKEN